MTRVCAGELIHEMSHSAIFFGQVGYFKCKCCWEVSSRCSMLNSRGQNCRQQVSSLDLSCFKLMKHGSGCGGGGSALHPLLVCREAPQAQRANEGLISLWTASRSRGWSPWHRHTEQDKQTRCPHYILYSCTVSRWGTVVQEVKSWAALRDSLVFGGTSGFLRIVAVGLE